MKVEIGEETLSKLMWKELLGSAEIAPNKKLKKALVRSAKWYMTYAEITTVFGKEEADREYS